MAYRIIPLAGLNDDELMKLAALHRSVMETLLSDLGPAMVQKYYQAARVDPSVIGFCMVSASGEMLGWAMGSPHPEEINAKLRSPLGWFVAQMLRLAVTRPGVLWQLASTVLSSSDSDAMPKETIELTYIGVARDQRGKGIGAELLQAFIEACRAAKYHSVELSVEVENEPAVALYKKAGFTIIRTFSEGYFQRHRMELRLAP